MKKIISSLAAIAVITSALPFGSAMAASDLFGDINADGIIDGRDATMLLTYYAKTSTGYTNSLEQFVKEQTGTTPSPASGSLFGDINGDSIVDGRDATMLLTYYAKTSTGYEGSLEQFVAEQTGNKPVTNPSQTSDAEVVFDFGNYEAAAGKKDLVVSVKVDSKNKAISAMDVIFQIDSPLKITAIDEEIPAFNTTAMTNIGILGINFHSIDSKGEPLVPTSDAVFNLQVEIPDSTASGTYKVGFGNKNEVHKSNDGSKYTVGTVNGNIKVTGASK